MVKYYQIEEIAQTMCQSELGHETNAVLSFIPILAGRWFGAYPAFVITSILAAIFDLLFVMMQRYNRQRIMRMIRGERYRPSPKAIQNGEMRYCLQGTCEQ